MRLRDDDQHLCGIVHRKFLDSSEEGEAKGEAWKISQKLRDEGRDTTS